MALPPDRVDSHGLFCDGRNALARPWAAHCRGDIPHEHEAPHPTARTYFQQDRDRLLHSEAFRRLGYKTQVFVVLEGDFYRTRLTHTLEVSQVARGLACALGANEDLCEAVAYAHDLGHPPFGHRGEAALDALFGDALEQLAGLKRPEGGRAFEQNFQSYRIVSRLERRYPRFPGLNLSWWTLHGILKHHTVYDNPALPYPLKAEDPAGAKTVDESYMGTRGCSVEAQIVNLADQIAWVTHDLEDALRVRFLTVDEIGELDIPLLRKAWERALVGAPSWEKDRILWGRLLVRNMIDLLIQDVLAVSSPTLAEVGSLDEVMNREGPLVDFSPEMARSVGDLREILFKRVYTHPVVERMSAKAAGILERLFASLTRDLMERDSLSARLLPYATRQRLDQAGGPVGKLQVVVDFLAGMTDRFASEFYRVLYEPDEKGITSLY
jgi:dGTPase